MLALSLGAMACAAMQDPAVDSGTSEVLFDVRGRVVDLAGEPVESMFVTVSTEYCVPDQTDADGSFEVTRASPGAKRIVTYGDTLPDGIVASLSLAFSSESDHDFAEPLVTPWLEETHPIEPDSDEVQVVATSDELELTLQPGALALAPFRSDEILVARVPVAQAPAFTPDDVVLLDLFALDPILSTIEPPAAMRFPPDLGLAPGTAVVFHALDYDTGLLEPVADGTVDEDGRPATASGVGLAELTWVGLSVDQP